MQATRHGRTVVLAATEAALPAPPALAAATLSAPWHADLAVGLLRLDITEEVDDVGQVDAGVVAVALGVSAARWRRWEGLGGGDGAAQRSTLWH